MREFSTFFEYENESFANISTWFLLQKPGYGASLAEVQWGSRATCFIFFFLKEEIQDFAI